MTPGGSDPRYGWTIVAVLAVTETVSWGVLYYAFAVFQVPMQNELGWSKSELTGAFSLALAISALAAFPVGRWLDRHSPRPLMTLGSVLGALLVLAWSQVHDLFLFYLVWIGIGLAMACVLYEAAFTVVTKWFRVRRRQALTAVTLMGGFASFVFSPLSNRLIDAQGWRDALITLAVILAAATVPLHGLFLRRGPKHAESAAAAIVADSAATLQERKIAAAAAVGSSAFWFLTAAFVLSSFAISAVTVHLIPYLLEGGRSAGFGAQLVKQGGSRALVRRGQGGRSGGRSSSDWRPCSEKDRRWRCRHGARKIHGDSELAIVANVDVRGFLGAQRARRVGTGSATRPQPMRSVRRSGLIERRQDRARRDMRP